MQVSTKLFNQQAVNQFGKLTEEIQNLQAKVSTGKNILKSSDDPVAAVELSAAKEQKNILDRFKRNVDSAQRRLDLADSSMQQAINVMTRISELAIQAGNDTNGVTERVALRTEVEQLANVMLEIANTKDSQGQSLFSGYHTNSQAFVKKVDGTFEYLGDRGTHSLQISESMNVATSIDGGTAFQTVDTGKGRKSTFDIISNTINAISTASGLSRQGSAAASAALDFTVPRDPQNWSFTLTGSKGAKTISATVSEGKLSDVVTKINAETANTGISAALDSSTGRITLTETQSRQIKLDNIQIEGVDFSSSTVKSYVDFNTLSGDGTVVGTYRRLTDVDQLISSSVTDVQKATDHLSQQRAFLGAQINKSELQRDALDQRIMATSEKISDIDTADMAALVTRLQSLLLQKDAAQQAYAKIGQNSLFDYLK
ncbi:MAG: flagellar hook-associated protein FlgL [Candidatus Puniceispirillales bacterium]